MDGEKTNALFGYSTEWSMAPLGIRPHGLCQASPWLSWATGPRRPPVGSQVFRCGEESGQGSLEPPATLLPRNLQYYPNVLPDSGQMSKFCKGVPRKT